MFRLMDLLIDWLISICQFYLNGEEYDFLKTLSFERAQKTMENPTNRTPIWSSDR